MTTNNSLEAITINVAEIKNIQSLLLKTNYKLNEIWTPDEGNEIQIWFNKKLKTIIKVIITDNNPIEDNTTKVVNELVDLWLELRAIRNAVEHTEGDDYCYKTIKKPTALEKYYSSLEELEDEWNDNESYMSKIFKDNIDPSVLAYLHLDEDDKFLLTN